MIVSVLAATVGSGTPADKRIVMKYFLLQRPTQAFLFLWSMGFSFLASLKLFLLFLDQQHHANFPYAI